MTTKNTSGKNPVAELREKFFEKKRNRRPSQEIKDTLQKREAPAADKRKRAAKGSGSRDAQV